jgi:DNA mismatch endonuclease (patch repair protein)
MERDVANQASLEKDGWTVIRVWEHEVEENADACVDRIEFAVRASAASRCR